MKTLLLLKRLFLVWVFAFSTTAYGQILLTDDFDYAVGDKLTDNGWTAHSGAGTAPIKVIAGLSFTGYVGSGIGGAANLIATGEDVNRTFTPQTGTFYTSFLLKTSSTNNLGYFLTLAPTPVNSTFVARLWVNGGGNGIGIGEGSSAPSFIAITPETTYLIVIKRTSSATSLYVLNSLPDSEPATADQTYSMTGTTVAAITLRQYNASQRQIVDGIRVAKSWNDIFNQAITWDGTAWSNVSGPLATDDAVINGDYSGSAFEAKSLKVNATKTLTINSSVKSGDVTNNGNIIVNDGASFIQTAGATYTGAGTFVAKSSSTSAANKYTFWSSPIFNQNMYGIFGANTPPFVMTYNTATNYYDTLTNPATSVKGKGYSIKTAVANPAVSFSGVPNNGPFDITLSTAGEKYNLVGNPYPSNLDLAAFYTANSANIGSTIWFWDYTGGSVASQNGSTASNFGYATYNALGGTWLPAPSGSATPDVNYTKVGQAFIVEAASTTLSFDNNLRVADAGIVINKSSGANEGKFWLTLQTSYNAKVTQAITYQNGASNNFDNYDSRAIGLGSDAFYSLADTEKVVIQGKSTFNSSDVVALGNKHFEAGNFKIELTKKEGLFADGQAIYLRDKTLGTETNLQDGAYLFSSTAGDFSDRFEVVYSKSVLGTSAAAKSTLTVYRNGDDFVIDSPSKITSVEVYDASGKLVKSSKSNGNKETVSNLSRGVFILKITTATETVSKKVIK